MEGHHRRHRRRLLADSDRQSQRSIPSDEIVSAPMVETAKTTGAIVDVVNISSIGATIVVSGASAYQVSKLAVTRLTEFV